LAEKERENIQLKIKTAKSEWQEGNKRQARCITSYPMGTLFCFFLPMDFIFGRHKTTPVHEIAITVTLLPPKVYMVGDI